MKKLVALAAWCSLFQQFNALNSPTSSAADSNPVSETRNKDNETNPLIPPKPLIVLSELNVSSSYWKDAVKEMTSEAIWAKWRNFPVLETRMNIKNADDRKFLIWLKVHAQQENDHYALKMIEDFIDAEVAAVNNEKESKRARRCITMAESRELMNLKKLNLSDPDWSRGLKELPVRVIASMSEYFIITKDRINIRNRDDRQFLDLLRRRAIKEKSPLVEKIDKCIEELIEADKRNIEKLEKMNESMAAALKKIAEQFGVRQ